MCGPKTRTVAVGHLTSSTPVGRGLKAGGETVLYTGAYRRNNDRFSH